MIFIIFGAEYAHRSSVFDEFTVTCRRFGIKWKLSTEQTFSHLLSRQYCTEYGVILPMLSVLYVCASTSIRQYRYKYVHRYKSDGLTSSSRISRSERCRLEDSETRRLKDSKNRRLEDLSLEVSEAVSPPDVSFNSDPNILFSFCLTYASASASAYVYVLASAWALPPALPLLLPQSSSLPHAHTHTHTHAHVHAHAGRLRLSALTQMRPVNERTMQTIDWPTV